MSSYKVLTERQRTAFDLAAKGWTYDAIGKLLGVTGKHAAILASAYSRVLDAHNQTQIDAHFAAKPKSTDS